MARYLVNVCETIWVFIDRICDYIYSLIPKQFKRREKIIIIRKDKCVIHYQYNPKLDSKLDSGNYETNMCSERGNDDFSVYSFRDLVYVSEESVMEVNPEEDIDNNSNNDSNDSNDGNDSNDNNNDYNDYNYNDNNSDNNGNIIGNDFEPNPRFIGLLNLGNMCYMNASVQVLFATPEFLDHLSKYEPKNGPLTVPLTLEVLNLLTNMDNTNERSLDPSILRTVFKSIETLTKFSTTAQQDAHEFFKLFIHHIHSEINEPNATTDSNTIPPNTSSQAWEQYVNVNQSFLVNYFVGQLTTTITCKTCGQQKYGWEPFWDLSLALPDESETFDVINCINKFCELEELKELNSNYCEQCVQNRESTQQISITILPKILIIHLKMFDNDGRKLSGKHVTINQNISLKNEDFVLYACICHYGDMASGHYTAYCKHDEIDGTNWYLFNDDAVHRKDDITKDLLRNSYILFYIKELKE